MVALRLPGFVIAGVCFGISTAVAQSPSASTPTPPPPSHYAIQNARIVSAPGRVLARGTIVFKDGLITAVGASVAVPAGAWVIDGAGLTVYPGLVDAMSTVGLPASLRLPAPGAAGAQGGGGGPGGAAAQTPTTPYSWGPADRPATTSWLNAADELNATDERVATWRSAGFTAAVVMPERGFFPGQAAFVNLAGERTSEMVVRTPVALRVNLQGGPGHRGYPNSLLGSIAYIRQSFLDAQQYEQALAAYQARPAGLVRPGYDRALEPLRDALRSRRPVLFPANLATEVDRALILARDAGAAPVLYGAQEGYRDAAVIARAAVPVLVNVDWPVRDRDGDPDAEVALSTLRFRDRAPTTPGELERAGVRFAFYSGRLTDPKDMLANVRKAIALGLTADGALRALTLAPAEIFGVADRVGTLDVGKIANVVVTEGDLFQPNGRVKYVFVDGRKFEPVPPTETAAAGGRGGRQGGGAAADTAPPGPPVPMVVDRGPVRTSRVTLIRNATILTVTNGTITGGSILIRDGKIAALGPNVTAPADAQVIDATGKFVMPGIIDAHSHIAADAINEGSVAVSAMVGIRDVLDPDDLAIYEAAAGGVTTANILHGSANPIGGRNAVIKMRWGADAEGLLVAGAPPGIKFALGENTKRDREPDRYPATRMGVMDVIREAFLEAREYQRQWRAFETARRARQPAIPPRRDLKLETLAEILDGKRLVHAHSYRADEILQLIRLAEEFGFKIATFQHVLEGYKVADEIARHGAGASTFSDWWAYKVEAYDAIPYNAALMTQRGVTVSINSDSREEMRHLNQEAAKTMRYGGLSETEALRLVTLNPAQQLGIADRVGSIEVGKDADLVVFNNHPLSVYSQVEQTLIDGQVYFDRQADLARRTALAAERAALLAKERGTVDRPRVTTSSAETPREERP
jgi:imidazolonepropionase-like amidohydrolase